MGRLFWKIFLGFWLTLVSVAAAVGMAVHWYGQDRLRQVIELVEGPRAEVAMSAVAATLQHAGITETRQLLLRWRSMQGSPVFVVDDQGRDLLDRPVPPQMLARADEQPDGEARRRWARRVTAGDRDYLLFIPADFVRPPFTQMRRPLAVQLSVVLFASLLFSAGLAWYLARPVHHLREASRKLAEGTLGARVMPLIGKRRDEIADLGRDFDHMAGRVQTLVDAQKRLLHDVSHELRSPLARMQVAVGLARQQPNKVDAAIDRIEQESQRLDELVGEVLTLSRLETAMCNDADEYVDVTSLLETVTEDAQFEAGARNCRIELNAEGEMLLRGRGEVLRRAFENVIRNAIAYTRPGSRVAVSARSETDGRQVTIEICDEGPGVPEAALPVLFEPFYRADNAPVRGYGLGLAIAQRAILAYGGAIRAFNRDQGGLCIEMHLPVVGPPADMR